MADQYYSWTVTLAEADVPHDLAPVGGELPEAIANAMAHPNTIMTSSRKDWLQSMLLELFDASGGSVLAFLIKDPNTLPNIDPAKFKSVGGKNHRIHWQEVWVNTMLPNADITLAIEELDAWLNKAKTNPEQFAALLSDGCDANEIVRYLSEVVEDGACLNDGDSSPYLFCFIKVLRNIMIAALENNLAIVHVRYVYLFREIGA